MPNIDPYHSHPFPEAELCDKAEQALALAKSLGADQADVALNDENGFSVSARNGEVETVEHHQEHGFAITVYRDRCTGSTSSSDLTEKSIRAAVEKAVNIAKFSGRDDYAGIADADRLAHHYPELALYHHWDITPSDAIKLAIECDRIACEQDSRIEQCESANVSTYDGFRVYANSHGFVGRVASSRHSISCSLIAKENGKMQRDYEYTMSRYPERLDDVSFVAKQAAQKTIHRLGAHKIETQACPVILNAPIAKGLLGSFISAISGSSLYREATFLLDHLDKKVFPDFVHIFQEPHLSGAIGSAPFDAEGVRTEDRDFVRDGILTSYVLGSYSARKLGMSTTGNAGGVYNLSINHSEQNLQKLLKTMNTGLFVTELMGQGINILTGDYSRGATGFWVENGEIVHPVEEVTIAGNLRDMYANIVAVGNDVDRRGSICTGSILLSEMMIAGK